MPVGATLAFVAFAVVRTGFVVRHQQAFVDQRAQCRGRHARCEFFVLHPIHRADDAECEHFVLAQCNFFTQVRRQRHPFALGVQADAAGQQVGQVEIEGFARIEQQGVAASQFHRGRPVESLHASDCPARAQPLDSVADHPILGEFVMASPLTNEQANALLDLLSTNDKYRALFASDPAAALGQLPGAPKLPSDASPGCCLRPAKLADKRAIAEAREKILQGLVAMQPYIPKVLEA